MRLPAKAFPRDLPRAPLRALPPRPLLCPPAPLLAVEAAAVPAWATEAVVAEAAAETPAAAAQAPTAAAASPGGAAGSAGAAVAAGGASDPRVPAITRAPAAAEAAELARGPLELGSPRSARSDSTITSPPSVTALCARPRGQTSQS